MTAGLLDTSVFIAREDGRRLGELPERVAVSVVTIGELQLGVLAASDDEARARRADTLALARAADPIQINEAVMVTWARLVADCRAAGIHRAIKLTDSLIAATAIEHGLPVVSQDGDFAALAEDPPAAAGSERSPPSQGGQKKSVWVGKKRGFRVSLLPRPDFSPPLGGNDPGGIPRCSDLPSWRHCWSPRRRLHCWPSP